LIRNSTRISIVDKRLRNFNWRTSAFGDASRRVESPDSDSAADPRGILVFAGDFLTAQQAHALEPAAGAYLIQIDTVTYLDPQDEGRFINHSCDTNVGIVGGRLVAIRAILEGEEILLDYSTTIGVCDPWTMRCLCGSAHCRRTIGAFAQLPDEMRVRYLALGIVPDFIRREIRPPGAPRRSEALAGSD
jgi:hypothetical protein